MNSMKTYHIFLGSSIQEPVSYDRCAVGNFIRKINDALREYGTDLYLYLFLCELGDPSFTPGKRLEKQQEYDDLIMTETDLFLNLYHNKAGSYTRREYEVAQAALASEDILVMFRTDTAPDTTITELQAQLQEHGQPYAFYDHIDQVKLALVRWLQRKEPNVPMSVENGRVIIGNSMVLHCN